jgi:hypothetical protein
MGHSGPAAAVGSGSSDDDEVLRKNLVHRLVEHRLAQCGFLS